MGFYDDTKNVHEYMKMAEGYDGKGLIDKLKSLVPAGSSVLELGMGPGVDLNLLSEFYATTGSDTSQVFLDLYKTKHSDADLLTLDAVTLDTERTFQCIYSNKVLHHLSKHELALSFARQQHVVEPGGIAMHSFWSGDGVEEMHGMTFTYYTEDTLTAIVGDLFEILECSMYAEMEDDDSLCLILKRI